MPLTVTGDKGTELGKLIALVTTMRQRFQPFLSEEQLPAFRTVKSVYNITRERGWRPLWEKLLSGILMDYQDGKYNAGFVETDQIHKMISFWLWGAIVQTHLDQFRKKGETHRVRSQRNILLPSGGRRIHFYTNPTRYGRDYADCLIPVDTAMIDALLAEHDHPDLLRFGSEAEVAVCESIYAAIGSPVLASRTGWKVFTEMVTIIVHTSQFLRYQIALAHIE